MINLFEYQNKLGVQASFDSLEGFLNEIWNSREKSYYFSGQKKDNNETQRFIQFIHKTKSLKSNNYVGVIHYEGIQINLLPKIFYDQEKEYSENEIGQIQNHILWWLSYCRRIKFPNYRASLSSTKSNFFEVLICLFSKYTRELLNSSIYQQYEEVNSELDYIKGRLNTNQYIHQNLTKGLWHKLNCSYDAFVFDNEFNRIIKYVSTLLFNVSTDQDNKKNLREILFLLDEVSDKRATAEQCSKISFNPMFGEFETVRDYCQLFLANCVSFDFKNDLRLFAFLLPMEYVFEDFVFGFIDKELEQVKAKSQKSNIYLDEDKLFNLRPDLWLKTDYTSLIADTKYKIVYSNEKDPKRGISQKDLYQMLAYAIRFEVDEVILFYPNTLKQDQEEQTELTVKDALAADKEISIKAFQLPVLNRDLLEVELNAKYDLSDLFSSTKIGLRNILKKILLPTI